MNLEENENNKQDNKNCSLLRTNTYEATRDKSQASILAMLISGLLIKLNEREEKEYSVFQ